MVLITQLLAAPVISILVKAKQISPNKSPTIHFHWLTQGLPKLATTLFYQLLVFGGLPLINVLQMFFLGHYLFLHHHLSMKLTSHAEVLFL